MNSKSENSSLTRLLLSFVLACGANMAWLISCMIIYAISEPWLPNISLGRAGFAIVLPSPLFLAWIEFFMGPMEELRTRRASDYFDALRYDWPTNAIAMFIAFALSTVLAIVCYRRQRRYSDHDSLAWALFVFLLGAPGFIGYLLHRRWPVAVRCTHCGQETPRDRDACLKCNAPFPPPAMKGIEAFA
jgi:hypothetical protein